MKHETTLRATTVESALSVVTEALKEQGFGVLTRIDVHRTLEEKIGAHMAPYVILGACNPPLAHAALQAQPDVGLLLPCNVVVRQVGDDVAVSAVAPLAMLSLMADADVEAVARQADAKLAAAIASLGSHA